ncbi:hypothetical protein PIB30_085840 [Stylosanthes scabra]|uniref:Uncharacterized protein n=1 Tax=Stylosanthes scabra TaxID=79078 RepID=A0ABU6ZRJ6_9FABA|nr:hypothetical protein [Stylosanthes scabra]
MGLHAIQLWSKFFNKDFKYSIINFYRDPFIDHLPPVTFIWILLVVYDLDSAPLSSYFIGFPHSFAIALKFSGHHMHTGMPVISIQTLREWHQNISQCGSKFIKNRQ